MKVCIISLCEEPHPAEMMAKEKMECVVKEGVINVNHGIVINCNIRKSWRLGVNLNICRVVAKKVVGVLRLS